MNKKSAVLFVLFSASLNAFAGTCEEASKYVEGLQKRATNYSSLLADYNRAFGLALAASEAYIAKWNAPLLVRANQLQSENDRYLFQNYFFCESGKIIAQIHPSLKIKGLSPIDFGLVIQVAPSAKNQEHLTMAGSFAKLTTLNAADGKTNSLEYADKKDLLRGLMQWGLILIKLNKHEQVDSKYLPKVSDQQLNMFDKLEVQALLDPFYSTISQEKEWFEVVEKIRNIYFIKMMPDFSLRKGIAARGSGGVERVSVFLQEPLKFSPINVKVAFVDMEGKSVVERSLVLRDENRDHWGNINIQLNPGNPRPKGIEAVRLILAF